MDQQPTKAERAAEAYRRGLMGPQTTERYEEAVRRGIVHDPYAAGRVTERTGAGPVTGGMQVLSNAIPGFSEATAALSAAGDTVGDAIKGRGADFGANWNGRRARQAGSADQFAADHPVATSLLKGTGGAAQVAGALATGGASEAEPIAAAASSGVKALAKKWAIGGAKNAVAGAAVAGANAAAQPGTLSQRAKAADAALLPGAAVGVALPVGLKAAVKAGGVVSRAAGGIASKIDSLAGKAPGAPSPAAVAQGKDAALRWVIGAGVTPEKLAAAQAAAGNAPITAAEAIGPAGISRAAGLARRSAPTAEVAGNTMSMRAADRSNRILQHIHETTGVDPIAARGDVASIVDNGQKAAGPLFSAIHAQPGTVAHPELTSVLSTPVGKDALSGVIEDLQNARVDPAAHGFVPSPNGQGLMPGPGGLSPYVLDMTRRRINLMPARDQFNKVIPDSISPGNYNINRVGRDFTDLLAGNGSAEQPGLIPGLRNALDVSGDYISVRNAYDQAGGRLFGTSGLRNDPRTFGDWYQGLTPGQQAGAKASVINDMFTTLQNNRFRPTALQAPAVQTKLRAVFGDDAAGDLIARMNQEHSMSAASARMTPNLNSVTADTLGVDDPGAGAGLAAHAAQGALSAATGRPWGVVKAVVGIGRLLGDTATQDASAATRDAAGAYLYGTPDALSGDLASFLSAQAAKRAPMASITTPAVSALKWGLPAAVGQQIGQNQP